jgi:hypothetical protein
MESIKIPVISVVKAASYFNTCRQLGETDYRELTSKTY